MTLKELTNDHYIIIDDSKINNGDVHFDFDKNEIDIWEGNLHSNRFKCKKITHSTQPLELLTLSENGLSGIGFSKVKPLNIFNVKELIGEVDVAFERYPIIENDKEHNDRNYYRRSAYYQALEDNKEKKYTEEDVIAIVEKSRATGLTAEYIIQSLQPKTEWEVEFLDGKLKLK